MIERTIEDVDRYLRNNLGDDDYASFSAAIEALQAEVENATRLLAVAMKERDSAQSKLREIEEGPLTDYYVLNVPDKCDRIVWRNNYYHLPLFTSSAALAQPEPSCAQQKIGPRPAICERCGTGTCTYVENPPNPPVQQRAQPEPVELTNDQDRALCEAYCNTHSDEYFKARPQLDSDVNRRTFYAGHRKAWLTVEAAKGGAL